jgi:hypothetical protein
MLLFATKIAAFIFAVIYGTKQPSISLRLTPQWSEDDGAITSISTRMTIDHPSFPSTQPFLRLVTSVGPTPSMDYSGEHAIAAVDEAGILELLYVDDDRSHTRTWSPTRRTKGSIILDFEVYPRITNTTTPIGPRIDFRANSGGLIGTGNVFVPTLLSDIAGFKITVDWDLSLCPDSTQSVWSYGTGAHVERIGLPTDLVDTVYTVSPDLYSWTDPLKPEYGFYWLTPPPQHLISNVSAIAVEQCNLYTRYSEFFDDAGPGYRIFMREAPRGYGGGAYQWSYVFEWDKGVRIGRGENDTMSKLEELNTLFSHEMVHNWPRLQSSNGLADDEDTLWYTEGESKAGILRHGG